MGIGNNFTKHAVYFSKSLITNKTCAPNCQRLEPIYTKDNKNNFAMVSLQESDKFQKINTK